MSPHYKWKVLHSLDRGLTSVASRISGSHSIKQRWHAILQEKIRLGGGALDLMAERHDEGEHRLRRNSWMVCKPMVDSKEDCSRQEVEPL
jgi:hypothetical protein